MSGIRRHPRSRNSGLNIRSVEAVNRVSTLQMVLSVYGEHKVACSGAWFIWCLRPLMLCLVVTCLLMPQCAAYVVGTRRSALSGLSGTSRTGAEDVIREVHRTCSVSVNGEQQVVCCGAWFMWCLLRMVPVSCGACLLWFCVSRRCVSCWCVL